MQDPQVQSLVQEDPTCRGAAKPRNPNDGAHTSQSLKPESPGARAPQEKPAQWEALTLHGKVALLTATREKPTQQETQHSQKQTKL